MVKYFYEEYLKNAGFHRKPVLFTEKTYTRKIMCFIGAFIVLSKVAEATNIRGENLLAISVVALVKYNRPYVKTEEFKNIFTADFSPSAK